MVKASFRDQGIAKVDRLDQDLGQKACSSDKPPAESVARQIEAERDSAQPSLVTLHEYDRRDSDGLARRYRLIELR